MERIVIEVTPDTAKKWRLSSQQQKDRITQITNVILAKELMRDSPKEFRQFLDEIGAKMEGRGLTEDILQDILSDD